jgi:transcriptional regulator with XRE-family HTH domain
MPLYITEWREHLRLSQTDVANRVGTSKATVSRWENEQHRLNPEKISNIAKALEIKPGNYGAHQQPGQALTTLLRACPTICIRMVVDVVRRIVNGAPKGTSDADQTRG